VGRLVAIYFVRVPCCLLSPCWCHSPVFASLARPLLSQLSVTCSHSPCIRRAFFTHMPCRCPVQAPFFVPSMHLRLRVLFLACAGFVQRCSRFSFFSFLQLTFMCVANQCALFLHWPPCVPGPRGCRGKFRDRRPCDTLARPSPVP